MPRNVRRINNPFQMIKNFKEDDKGVVAIIVGLSIFVLLGFGALAVDLGYSMLVKNELQNAADAGALAGARELYINNGTAVNPSANQLAYDTATQNMSQKEAVYINWTSGANVNSDIERGHWKFATREFTPNDSLLPVDLANSSTTDLDNDTDFINAVRVKVRTQTPVASFLSRIWGGAPSFSRAEAIAYIGFAGELRPHDVDQPIAICKQSILNNAGEYDCTGGACSTVEPTIPRITRPGGPTSANPVTTANDREMRSLICAKVTPSRSRSVTA